ncbi:MAG: ATP-binding protein [Thaumarchaeota archaeon]|nr:ATP-binding protein [Nitrososphaerota archaeon]
MPERIFDDMDGKFDARLRRVFPSTKTAKSGDQEIVVTNVVATVEAKFDFRTLERLYSPNFVAIEKQGGDDATYLIFEVVGVNPIHFQMLGMDVSMPTLLRREYLDTISESWGNSQETWIDMAAVPTWYSMKIEAGQPKFERSRTLPLAGAKVYLLSKKTVENFLCYPNGETVGTMLGFELPLTISLENLIRYHAGIFGFTGAGKSNLTSVLLRKVMNSKTDISVVVIDVSGEYATHLIDLLETDGRILSYETMEDEEQLYNSQVIPESLEGSVSDEAIRGIFSGLLKKNLVQKLSYGAGTSSLDLASLEELLTSTAEDGKSGAVVAKIGRERLENKFFKEMKLPRNAKLSELNEAAKAELLKLLNDIKGKVNDRTSLYAEVNAIAEYVEQPAGDDAGAEEELTPERLAWQLVKDEAPKLNVLYLPDPGEARMIVSRLIRKLLALRKKQGSKKKILIVLDEAQEYIPGETRDRDGTVSSNTAVEALLRQGRKYRIHCWLATQRVARLNVSALQQLHSYFVSTLPRFYDRMVISESFGLPLEVLERTAQLDTGEWVFVSYKATRRKNVPVFLRTDNNEEAVAKYLKS